MFLLTSIELPTCHTNRREWRENLFLAGPEPRLHTTSVHMNDIVVRPISTLLKNLYNKYDPCFLSIDLELPDKGKLYI